jgi:phage regulator Rha-like protein
MKNLSIITNNQTLTMSSREIAEYTGKNHSHVFRDISKMLDDLNEDRQGYTQVWTHPQNKQRYEEYVLDRDHTDCLLTGYSAKARMSVIKRWRELELDSYEKIASQNPNKIDSIDSLQQEVELKERNLKDRMKACSDLKCAIERFKALESQEDSTPLLANVKTQQQIEDEFMLSVINSSKATDIFNIECNAIRRKNNPFQAYKRRGMAREMLRKSFSRLIDSGATSSKQVGIQSH